MKIGGLSGNGLTDRGESRLSLSEELSSKFTESSSEKYSIIQVASALLLLSILSLADQILEVELGARGYYSGS